MDQFDRLILQVTGEDDVKRLTARLAELEGEHRRGGRGILGASYAFQDFTSVLSGGGGLTRAMGAVSNNIDQLAMAAGASAANAAKLSIAFTGLVAVLPLVTPLFQKFWDAMTGGGEGPDTVVKALDMAEERLKRIRSELEKIMKSEGMEEHATRGRIEEFFAGRGPDITGKLALALGASGRGAQMTTAEVAATGAEGLDRAMMLAEMNASRAGRVMTDAERAAVRARALEGQQAARDAAQKRINEANVQAAGLIMGEAPLKRGARDTLRALARQFPRNFPADFAEELGGLEPEAVQAQEADVEAQVAFGDRATAGTAARRQERQKQRDFLRRSKREGQRLKQLTDRQIAEEEAGTRATAADNKAEAAEMNAAAAPEESRRAVNLRAARRNVTAVTQGMGLTPNPEQLDQMASSALSGMANGLNAQQAAWFSVQRKLESIQQMAMQFQAAQSRMMMGGDQNGHFPQTPALWP